MLSPINIDCTFLHCKSNTIGLAYPLIYVAKVCTFVATGIKNEINASFSLSAHRFSYNSGIVAVFDVTFVHWFTTPSIIYFLLLVFLFLPCISHQCRYSIPLCSSHFCLCLGVVSIPETSCQCLQYAL